MVIPWTPVRSVKSFFNSAPQPAPEAASHPIQLGCTKIPEGVIMPSLGTALQELRKDRSATQLRLEKLNQIISGIESLNGSSANGSAVSSQSGRPIRIVSSASRRKMALAQQARWAKVRGHSQPISVGKQTSPASAKRTISAAGRKRIAAAQRARWAKVRAGKK
jgi:hypothetical protein